MKNLLAILLVISACAAQAAEPSSRDTSAIMPTPSETSFAVTMSRWPIWSVNSGWSSLGYTGLDNGLLYPLPGAALKAILSPMPDLWQRSAVGRSEAWKTYANAGDGASAEVQLSLRPGVSMLWELANQQGELFEFDEVTLTLGVRLRF